MSASLGPCKRPVVQRAELTIVFHQSSDTFALKQLPPTREDWFKWEMEAFERIPLHAHLTPLHATIEHHGHFHLLLPWADGRNLR
jgi:hypothetical protein